jgi:hypothetical protein
MTTLLIYHDTRYDGVCRSCGAPIVWAQLVTGKRMPFDPPLVVKRTQHTLIEPERAIDYLDMDATRSHFASCPDAAKWRRVTK